MPKLTYNLIVKAPNQGNGFLYWAKIQALAREYTDEPRIVLANSSQIAAVDLTRSTLDEKAWKLYGQAKEVINAHEEGIVEANLPRWALLPHSRVKRIESMFAGLCVFKEGVPFEIEIGEIYGLTKKTSFDYFTKGQSVAKPAIQQPDTNGHVKIAEPEITPEKILASMLLAAKKEKQGTDGEKDLVKFLRGL